MSETLLNADPVAAEPAPSSDPAPAPAEPNSLLTPAPAEGDNIQITESEWRLSPTIKGTGDAPEWFKAGKYGSVEDQAKAYTALEGRFGGFSGAPDTYEFTAPEGVEFNFDSEHPMYSKAIEFAKEKNMDQDTFNGMVGMYVSEMAGNQVDPQQEMATRLPEVLGENHAQVIDRTSHALVNLLDADTYEKIAPYCNTPEAIALANEIILATAPKVPPIDGGSNPSGVTKAKLNEMRSERISDGPHKGELRWHADPDFRKEVRSYAAALHGE